jgi:PAS domain S-box-containing protein
VASEADFGWTYWRSAAPPQPASPAPAGIGDEQFRLLADNMPSLCWIGNSDGYIVWYNRLWYLYTGTTPAEMEGWGWQSVHDPDQLPAVMDRWTSSIASGQPFEMTFPLRGADGVFRPFLTRVQPQRDAEGRVVRWFGTNTDVSPQVAAEAALRERESVFRGVFDSPLAGLGIVDLGTGRILAVNDYLVDLLGHPRELFDSAAAWTLITPPEFHELDERAIRQILETGQADPFEKEYLRADGSRVPVRLSAALIPGKTDQIVVHVYDITDRRRAEEHQRLLINELNHRVKNTLAIVQSIAQQSFRGGVPTAAAKAAFEARLAALSAAHNILTERSWQSASMGELVARIVAPLAGGGSDRFIVEGPEIQLQPRTAVSLALALHELGTNAVKYGALTERAGRVEIRWLVEAERLKLVWRERGGPPVVEPGQRGFGSRLLERGLAADLGGTVRIRFDPEGVVCTMDAPLPSGVGG